VSLLNLDLEIIPLGKAEIIQEGRDIQIWSLGSMMPDAIALAKKLSEDGHSVGIVNARFAKPIDTDLLEITRHYMRNHLSP
jgi:1-deoxy-D-xylulose-5-phosphate synthase